MFMDELKLCFGEDDSVGGECVVEVMVTLTLVAVVMVEVEMAASTVKVVVVVEDVVTLALGRR